MYTFYLFSVWLHILAVAVWIGGMVFLTLVVVPIIRRPEHRNVAAVLIHQTGIRFRGVGWACLGLLLLSGLFNLSFRGFAWTDMWSGWLWQDSFGNIIGVKLFLVGIILILSVWHDFVVGPQATALWQADPTSAKAQQLRRQSGWFGRFNLLLALVVVALGVMLGRG
jgi:copper resistance protein D